MVSLRFQKETNLRIQVVTLLQNLERPLYTTESQLLSLLSKSSFHLSMKLLGPQSNRR